VEGRTLLIDGGDYHLCDGTGTGCHKGGCHKAHIQHDYGEICMPPDTAE